MENGKYLIVYDRKGILHYTDYGDENRVTHYLNQGFVVSICDTAKDAVYAVEEYAKMMRG